MMVCEQMHDIVKNCSDCIEFISTCEDLPKKLKSMDEKIPLVQKKEKYPEDLKDVFKNLLYLTTKIALHLELFRPFASEVLDVCDCVPIVCGQ